MEDSGNSFDAYETNVLPLWEAPPHDCCVVDQNNVDCLRRRIKYYFMNPCEKYHARGRKPWKLLLQLVKIAIITAQLVSFGLSNQMVVTFKEENLMTFKHLFLKNHADGDSQSYAVYRQTDVYEYLSHIIKQYGNLYNITLGNHEYEKNGDLYSPLWLCQMFYRNGSVYAGNETFEIDAEVDTDCIQFYPMHQLSSEDIMSRFTLHFKRLVSVTVTFVLKAINLQTVRYRELPDCYDFTVTITFNNMAHSGRIKIDMEHDVSVSECRDWEIIGVSAQALYLTEMFDCLIIVTCITSFILCTRSIITGLRLQREYTRYCRKSSGKDAPWSDKLEFVNGWYILIIISDTLSVTGSILKIEIQNKVVTSYDICSIFLGTGTMLVWMGVIRYMGYFKKYNILILTLRAALPNVIRFICCAGIIYLGYCFCGWIVIGPYHEKFRTLNTVSECLFSLINGDDMFPTFNDMKQKSSLVWIFSRVYLYSFVSLFIYMILSLFITIITDTYSTIKQQDQSGTPTSQLQEFLSTCNDLPNSGVYRLDQSSSGCCLHFLSRFPKDEQMLTSEA